MTKLNLEINNQTKSPVKKRFFEDVIKKVFKEAGFEFLKNKTVSISIALVGEKEIKKLNRAYRKKNSVTDVLSFGEYKNQAGLKKEKSREIFLGELILCYNDIKKYAKKEGIVFKRELQKVAAHGVLHLLGLNHGKKMFAIQEKIIKKI